MAEDIVVVTGASGFVAKHVVARLLDEGFRVRGTVRSAERGTEVRDALLASGRDASRFDAVVLDLTQDRGWEAALDGCPFVLHTASPFPRAQPRDRTALVAAAEGGTRRVMRAARNAGVRRVVVTSSVAAMAYGHGAAEGPFGERDWTNVGSPDVSPYALSKTLGERAAREEAAAAGIELVAINPAVVLGPLLDRRYGTSVSIVAAMLRGRLPFLPDIAFGIVDVRDVADAHVAALRVPGAAGRRFVVSAGERSLVEIADVLAGAKLGRRIARRRLPSALVRLAARVVPSARMVAAELDRVKRFDAGPAREILGLQFHDADDAIRATARSLLERGLA